jgi:hypothetical protein
MYIYCVRHGFVHGWYMVKTRFLRSKIFNAKDPQNLQMKFFVPFVIHFVSFVLNEFDPSFFCSATI